MLPAPVPTPVVAFVSQRSLKWPIKSGDGGDCLSYEPNVQFGVTCERLARVNNACCGRRRSLREDVYG